MIYLNISFIVENTWQLKYQSLVESDVTSVAPCSKYTIMEILQSTSIGVLYVNERYGDDST